MEPDLSIVILAAGLGTRMKSKKAKVLHEAGGCTLVEHVVQTALSLAEPDRIVTVVGHQADRVRAVLAGKQVRFVEQTEQKGTGHALMVCRDAVPDHKGLLIVLYGDCPLLSASTLQHLIQHHRASHADATVITTHLDDPTGYGRIILDPGRKIHAIVEEKVANSHQRAVKEINSGIYCFNAETLWKHLEEITPNPVSQEYYLTDIVEIFNRAGLSVRALLHQHANELLGINTRVDLAAVDRIFRERKVQELMLAGVTIEKPETVIVDSQVQAGTDTVIEAFSRILGTTTIGEDCHIGSGAIIRDSQIGNGVTIAPYTLVNASRIDKDASVGPFARLRQNNHIEAGAHIGNFVELKKTHFGAGAKAGHLAYLGDSEIGAGVNIGAGTITCNYDGHSKHKTTIGEQAFIGSNATLVAPVEIGEGAYTAAGSVITENVPPDALAFGRSRQMNKEEWARKRREKLNEEKK
jgi:bifunctional UDP-N-acetylglucosamine pyrophosphorylase/glucosamine-1-phosphate N-acetyltransferase